MPIKAIETRYAGCRFRSRLEARWAVFFDHLPYVEWEYEPQGFHTSAGPYLPDFRLHLSWTYEDSSYQWIEIKGTDPSADELNRWHSFAAACDENVYMFLGDVPRDPDHHECQIIDCSRRGVPAFMSYSGAPPIPMLWEPPTLGELPNALHAARSARFEHGEIG